MRLDHSQILAMAIMMLLPAGRLIAAEPTPAAAVPEAAKVQLPNQEAPAMPKVADSVEEFAGNAPSDNVWLDFEDAPEVREVAARFGWWGVHNTGSLNMTGEWQGLHPSSPFFDVEGLWTNGQRTLDAFASGPENETTKAGLYFYNGPGLTAKLNYDRFLHQLGHEPFPYNPGPPPTGFNPTGLLPATVATNPTFALYGEDRSIGQDYAFNVQTLKVNFKGDLTENIKWRLNVWGLEKEGMRQTNALTHCYATPAGQTEFNGAVVSSRCHVVSRAQHVDWLTMEIEPVIEARLTDWATIEYSRTMRSFQQSDDTMLNGYTGSGTATGNIGAGPNRLAEYGLVPENYTEIDRLKLGAQLGDCTDMYLLGYLGNMTNRYRDIQRHFSGVDGRITNQSLDGLQLTGYGRVYNQDTTEAPFLLDGLNGHPQQYENTTNRFPTEPIDRDYGAVGVKGRWKPFHDECGTLRSKSALIGGYEYSLINRRPAEFFYELEGLHTTVGHPNTNANKYFVGAQQDWTCTFNTYLKYTIIDTNDPLYGATPGQTGSDPIDALVDDAINTSLPTHEDRIELNGTWTPTDNFMLSGTFFIERTYNHSEFAHFEEDHYPFMINAWYAPTCKWSVSGGYAQLTNWIQQDITLGNQGLPATPPIATPQTFANIPASITNQSPWEFMGKADLLTFSTSYLMTERLSLTGGFEYMHGINAITSIPDGTVLVSAPGTTAATPYPDNVTGQSVSYADIPGYSRVTIDSYRVSAGLDYLLRRNMSTFFRYNYYDYRDETMAWNSGTSHMFLGGLTGTY
jgi:hypothetical protein